MRLALWSNTADFIRRGLVVSFRRTCQVGCEERRTDLVWQVNFSQSICAAKGTWVDVRHFLFERTGPVGESGGESLYECNSSYIQPTLKTTKAGLQHNTHFAKPRAVSARSMVVSCPNSR